MASLTALLSKWPVVRQIWERGAALLHISSEAIALATAHQFDLLLRRAEKLELHLWRDKCE